MIRAPDLIERFRYALDNAWGYIWGKAGTIWTAEKQRALKRSYEASGKEELRYSATYGGKWIGHRVADCSGLFAWAFSELGGSIYHGSDTIWRRYLSKRGELKDGLRSDGTIPRPGTAVFLHNKKTGKRSHIGLYAGDGICIEAKGTQAGVVTSPLSHWDEWGELAGVSYGPDTEVVLVDTLRRGSRGPEVAVIQERLNQLGYDCGISDGVYGAITEAAVMRFQAAEGLTVDGIAGPATQERLQAAWEEQQLGSIPLEPAKPHDEKAVVTFTGETFAALQALRGQLAAFAAAIDAALVTDGGEDNA